MIGGLVLVMAILFCVCFLLSMAAQDKEAALTVGVMAAALFTAGLAVALFVDGVGGAA